MKLQIMIRAQKTFPTMLGLIRKLLRYLMPCTELSRRYVVKNLRPIDPAFLFVERFSHNFGLTRSSDRLPVLLETSTCSTMILLTAWRLHSREDFGNMMRTGRNTRDSCAYNSFAFVVTHTFVAKRTKCRGLAC